MTIIIDHCIDLIMLRKQRMETALTNRFNPTHLLVENESNNHHVPAGSETHFKLIVVADAFQHLSRVARHKLIFNLLQPELDAGLHALSMHLYTPDEWKTKQDALLASPACRDGYKNR